MTQGCLLISNVKPEQSTGIAFQFQKSDMGNMLMNSTNRSIKALNVFDYVPLFLIKKILNKNQEETWDSTY